MPISQSPLRILFVMPPCLPTPPKGYGGIEAVAAALIPKLRQEGAYIILTTPNGSTVKADEVHELTEPLYPILTNPYNDVAPAIELYVSRVMKLAWELRADVIHDFSGMFTTVNSLAAATPSGMFPPVVQTVHGPIKPYHEQYESLLQYPSLSFTAISRAQLAEAPPKMRSRTQVIYNGITPSDFQYGAEGNGRLLVLGRVCSDKGQDRLVEYAAKAGLSLDIAGTVSEMSDKAEIEREAELGEASKVAGKADFQVYMKLRPQIDGEKIRFHGNVSGQLKSDLLSGSDALVMPNRWAEPFGMVAIEAMASGTPVVAMKSGALPELIVHGVTGYLAETFEELCDYLRPEMLAKLDREACRRHAAERFSTTAIAREYLGLYRSLVRNRPAAQRSRAAAPRPAAVPLAARLEAAFMEQLPAKVVVPVRPALPNATYRGKSRNR